MDKTLERILMLMPHKPDGSLAHGAKKEFAQSVGLKNGNLVTDWINGRTNSYKNYLYEIAAKYGVSVAWLKGETDDPRPGYVMTDYGSMPDVQLIARAGERMTPEQRQNLLRYIRYMFPEAFDDQEQGK
jgi:hypothetical protein